MTSETSTINRPLSCSNSFRKVRYMDLNSVQEGYMTKKGWTFPTWRKRWFVLTPTSIYYFKKPEPEMLSKGGFDIADISIDCVNDTTFNIVTPTRTYHIIAQNQSSAKSWISSIQKYTKELGQARDGVMNTSKKMNQEAEIRNKIRNAFLVPEIEPAQLELIPMIKRCMIQKETTKFLTLLYQVTDSRIFEPLHVNDETLLRFAINHNHISAVKALVTKMRPCLSIDSREYTIDRLLSPFSTSGDPVDITEDEIPIDIPKILKQNRSKELPTPIVVIQYAWMSVVSPYISHVLWIELHSNSSLVIYDNIHGVRIFDINLISTPRWQIKLCKSHIDLINENHKITLRPCSMIRNHVNPQVISASSVQLSDHHTYSPESSHTDAVSARLITVSGSPNPLSTDSTPDILASQRVKLEEWWRAINLAIDETSNPGNSSTDPSFSASFVPSPTSSSHIHQSDNKNTNNQTHTHKSSSKLDTTKLNNLDCNKYLETIPIEPKFGNLKLHRGKKWKNVLLGITSSNHTPSNSFCIWYNSSASPTNPPDFSCPMDQFGDATFVEHSSIKVGHYCFQVTLFNSPNPLFFQAEAKINRDQWVDHLTQSRDIAVQNCVLNEGLVP